MPNSPDVVIAGGGVMGASLAYWLTRFSPKLHVRVIEKDPTYAQAATALSVASIRMQFSNAVNVAISQFGIGFIRNFQAELGHDVGIPTLGFKENGYLFLCGTDSAATTMREVASMQTALGADTRLLNAADVVARFPWMSVHDVVLGSFGNRDEGWFDNMGLLSGFRAAARAQGVEFIHDTVTALCRDGAHVTGVVAQQTGRHSAGTVVCAMGTRAGALLQMAGEPWPVEPRKRTVFVIDAPDARHPDAPLLVDHTGFYMRPEHGHWITATVPSHDPAVDPDDFTPNHQEFEDVIWPLIYARVPGFAAAKVVRCWVGQYDYNVLDQNAILGAHPGLPGLYMMNGFSGHGLQQAPAVGRGVAELILTGQYQTLDLSELGVERILQGRPFLERAVV